MTDIEALASKLLDAADDATLLPLPSQADPGFDLDAAYRVADRMRALRIERGAVPRGYKIGFTNRRIWPVYGIHAPIFGIVYAHTLALLDGTSTRASIARLAQPRLEPEIVFGLRAQPSAAMDDAALARCIEWVAHGFEIVQTHYEGWRFGCAADGVADGGLHGRLLVGPRVPADRFIDLAGELRGLRLELLRDGEVVDSGAGSAVLDGPLDALRQWIGDIASRPQRWPVAAGDVVTTGTLTDAWPVVAGQRWSTRLSDARLAGLELEAVA